uniref:Uncharacterized protein n=1 Tax=Hyaloperonospora arabidopsidis (strain Emoy2) TaxID=559515 RepID=M4BBD8_HYAAE
MASAPRDDSAPAPALQQMQCEHGEVAGMLQILRAKLADAEEENFDLRASMALFETETRLESDKKERAMQSQVKAIESQLAFVSEKLQTAERVKLRTMKEVEELQQKQLVETKRRDAERRLLATKRRRQETKPATSQSTTTTPLSQQQQVPAVKTGVAAVDTGIQTEIEVPEAEETSGSWRRRKQLKGLNAKLVSCLLTGPSRDLLTLLHGALVGERPGDEVGDERRTSQTLSPGCSHHLNNSPLLTQFLPSLSGNSSLNESIQYSSNGAAGGGATAGVVYSQSVFSQVTTRSLAPHASSMLSTELMDTTKAVQETVVATDRAKELVDVMGKMLKGDVSAVALAPVFIKYFTAHKDIAWPLMCSVLGVMYAVMHHCAHFQRFLLTASVPFDATVSLHTGDQRLTGSTEHPRIVLSGLRVSLLGEYLSARSERVSMLQKESSELSETDTTCERKELRSKLMSALCRMIKSNMKESAVVKDGLRVLCFWADLGFGHCPALAPDFKPLFASNSIPRILMTAEGSVTVKAQALRLLSQLLRVPEMFAEVKIDSTKSLLFHRCAKMLSCNKEDLAIDKASDMRAFQHEIVKIFWSMITSFPSEGIRFVLESTHGLASDLDGYRSILYYLAQLLDQETFEARTRGDSGVMQELVRDRIRWDLIRNAFELLALLSRYVDLRTELGGDDQVQSFLAVLHFLSNLTHDDVQKDSIVASARFIALTTTLSG